MTMTAQARGQAVYNYMMAQPAFSRLNTSEQLTLLNGLIGLYGADLTYIVTNATIIPSTLQNPAGQPVSTSGSPSAQTGATTAASSLIGTGKVT